MKDLNTIWIEGKLAEKGYLSERYNKKENKLETTITDKGEKEAKKMLKNPKWQLIAKAINSGANDSQLNNLMKKLFDEN